MKSQSAIGDKFKIALSEWTSAQIISGELFAKGFEPLWVDIGVYNKYIINLLFDLIDHQVDVEFNGVPVTKVKFSPEPGPLVVHVGKKWKRVIVPE